MRNFVVCCACCLLVNVSFSDVLQPGDSADRVLRELGDPDGSIHTNKGTVWLYEDGKVLVKDGVVARLDFLTEEELLLKERDHKRSIKAHKEYEADRQKRIKEGLAVKKRQLENPGFLSMRASSQLAYWRGFQKSYPGVDISTEMRRLNQQLMVEQATRDKMARARNARIEEMRKQSNRLARSRSCRTIVVRRSTPTCGSRTATKPAITEFEDTSPITGPIKGLPSGPVKSTVRSGN